MSKWLFSFLGTLIISVAVFCLTFRSTGTRVLNRETAEKERLGGSGKEDHSTVAEALQKSATLSPALRQQPAQNLFSSAIGPITRPDPNLGFGERLRAVHSLGQHLSKDEIASIYRYLLTPYSLTVSDQANEELLRNDLMNALVGQETPPVGLLDLLTRIYDDGQQSSVMRDYALQHIPLIYIQSITLEQEMAIQALWRGADEVNSSIGGTALLALVDIAEQSGALTLADMATSLDANRLKETVLAVVKAGADNREELAAITGVALCGRLNLRESLPSILKIADDATSIPLQIAAISSLSQLGGQEAEATLMRLASADNARLRIPAQSALKRLIR